MTARGVRWLTSTLVTAALLAGCGPSEADERAAVLDTVVTATFAAPVAFNLELDADEEDLAAFGEDAGPLADLLASSSLAGVLERDRLALGVRLADVDALQARSLGPGELYVRVDLDGLAALVLGEGSALEVELRRALRRSGLDEPTQEAVLAAVRGGWVRLEQPPAGGDSAGRALATVVTAALRSATPVDHLGALDAVPFDGQLTVELDPRAVLEGVAAAFGEDLGALPDELGAGVDRPLVGRMTVTDGLLRTVVLDLDAVLPEVDGAELVLDLRQLVADEAVVRAPETVVSLTVDDLRRALAVLPDVGDQQP